MTRSRELGLDLRGRLDDDEAVVGEQAAEQLSERRLVALPVVVGRVDEDEVVAVPARPLLARRAQDVEAEDDRARQAELLEVRAR